MLLGKTQIEKFFAAGSIVIDPFVPENLGSAQYDVSIGENIYREKDPLVRDGIYNPFDENHVRQKWGLGKAVVHSVWTARTGITLQNVRADDKIIVLQPGESILAHTQEFIGGACNFITTMMKARSSLGRNFITVCRCAGQGDIGYFNRWTMEITNNSRYSTTFLVVGRRVAQILFFKVDPVKTSDIYSRLGKYQRSSLLGDLKANWEPELMLPKQWKDRECLVDVDSRD